MIEAYKVERDSNANVLYADHPVQEVALWMKLLSWGLLVVVLTTVMLVMSSLFSPEESGTNLLLTTLISALFGIPLFLLVALGISALCSVFIATMDKVFSFGRVYWVTCMACALSILNTSVSFYAISELGMNRVAATLLSMCISMGLILGYTIFLGRLAGVAKKPRTVLAIICTTYTVLSSVAGLFLG